MQRTLSEAPQKNRLRMYTNPWAVQVLTLPYDVPSNEYNLSSTLLGMGMVVSPIAMEAMMSQKLMKNMMRWYGDVNLTVDLMMNSMTRSEHTALPKQLVTVIIWAELVV